MDNNAYFKALAALPFVGKTGDGGLNVWAPAHRDGATYSEECALGNVYGEYALDFIAEHGAMPIFSGVFRAMGQVGKWTGIEAGFACTIAAAAFSTPCAISAAA